MEIFKNGYGDIPQNLKLLLNYSLNKNILALNSRFSENYIIQFILNPF